jgi:hypothetical protein
MCMNDAYRDLSLQLRAEDHTAIRALLKSASVMCRQSAASDEKPHPYLPRNFFQAQSSKLEAVIPLPDSPLFTPIFPRRVPACPRAKVPAIQKRGSRQGNDATATTMTKKLDSVADLPAFIGAEPTNAFDIDDDEVLGPGGKKMYEENMVVVDGWRTSLFFLLSGFSIFSDAVIS